MIASNIAEILKKRNSIAILSHIMPDGDSIGSTLALLNVLKRMGKSVDAYSIDKVPDVYSFLPNAQLIKNCGGSIESDYEVVVVLDCGSMDRTGNCGKIGDNNSVIINIDHHGTNLLFADLNLVDTNASSTGELVYQIIKLMGIEILKDEAICLYTAVLTDTGGFRYSNTTSITHQIAGDLINTGIDFGKVYELIYKNYKYQDIKVMGKVLNSIELYDSGRIAYMQLLKEDLLGLNSEFINTSDLINYGRDIDSVEVAVFIKETEKGQLKASYRSKKKIDVKSICERHGGGGHIRAAGCTLEGDLPSVKESVIKELEAALKDDDM